MPLLMATSIFGLWRCLCSTQLWYLHHLDTVHDYWSSAKKITVTKPNQWWFTNDLTLSHSDNQLSWQSLKWVQRIFSKCYRKHHSGSIVLTLSTNGNHNSSNCRIILVLLSSEYYLKVEKLLMKINYWMFIVFFWFFTLFDWNLSFNYMDCGNKSIAGLLYYFPAWSLDLKNTAAFDNTLMHCHGCFCHNLP